MSQIKDRFQYIAKESYICLLQLSTNTAFAHKMLEAKLVSQLMEVVCVSNNIFIQDTIN